MFLFNKTLYKQIHDTAIGSPLSSTVANLVMEELQSWALKQIDFAPPFYVRYVDDIITAVPKNKITEIVETFNKYHNGIQFTSEVENNGAINFLDLTIIRTAENKLLTNWYHKPSWSGRYLNFLSSSH